MPRHTTYQLRLAALLPASLLLALAATASADDMRIAKKLIATGWDHPDSQRFRQHLAEIEKRPFDGVVLELIGRNDEGKPVSLRAGFSSTPWKAEWFQPCIDDLKAARPKRLTDNFVSFGANPGNVDWFDDSGWNQIVEHWRIAARVARQSGLRGILFDPEPYSDPYAQFRYAAQPEKDRHAFDDYYAQARRRGREVMSAVVAEYPDLTLFCYFMNSINAAAAGRANPRPALAALGYGLYPAFIDGWLDVLPPEVTLVDGCESAYRYNSAQEFLEAAVRIRGAGQELVSPENRAKYRAQVQVSFGIYLDAYWNPPDSPWYIDGLGAPRVDRLRANTATALRVADEYVWVYGEKFRWWPTPNGRVKPETWPEALTGSEDALRFARDPLDYARVAIARGQTAGTLKNLARNGDFAAEKTAEADGREQSYRGGGPPAGWSVWQEEASHGAFTWNRQEGATTAGSAQAAGVTGGCFIQSYPAEPGQRFAVRAIRKITGRGDASLRIRWQSPEGKWTHEGRDVLIFTDEPRDQWGELFGVAEVPDGVGRIVLLLGVAGQSSDQDTIWYDDIAVYRLE